MTEPIVSLTRTAAVERDDRDYPDLLLVRVEMPGQWLRVFTLDATSGDTWIDTKAYVDPQEVTEGPLTRAEFDEWWAAYRAHEFAGPDAECVEARKDLEYELIAADPMTTGQLRNALVLSRAVPHPH